MGDLLKLYAEMPVIEKDSKNPHFGNEYASLDGMLAKLKPYLAANGYGLRFNARMEGQDMVEITAAVFDETGTGQVESSVYMPVSGDPQKMGGVYTYGKRYALAMLFGLTTEHDDDGNAAAGTRSQDRTPPAPVLGEDWMDEEIEAGPFKSFTWRQIAAGDFPPEMDEQQAMKLLQDRFREARSDGEHVLMVKLETTGKAMKAGGFAGG